MAHMTLALLELLTSVSFSCGAKGSQVQWQYVFSYRIIQVFLEYKAVTW